MRTGVDIVDVKRIENILSSRRDSFYKKIFTENEVEYIIDKNNSAKTVAGLFACKEAVSKVFGRGIGSLNWKDIEILHDKNGRPFISSNFKIRKSLDEIGLTSIEISISHENNYAISFAVGF